MSSFSQFTRSLLYFVSNIFKKRSYDIVFYYPAHFNRGENGKNEFFEPLYEICRKNGLNFVIFEEPDYKTKHIRNPDTVPFDFPFFIVTLLRKIVPLQRFDSFQYRDIYLAKLLKPFLFRKFYFKHYIVLSQSMLGLFRGLNTKARIYDYQHGIIFTGHKAYFSSEFNAPPFLKDVDANVLLYGEGFKTLLVNNTKDNYYKSHTFVIGTDTKSFNLDRDEDRDKILFSLQFTRKNESEKEQLERLEHIDSFLMQNRHFFEKNKISLLMKLHPRYDGSIDISSLFHYPFVKKYEGDLQDALMQSFLHLTFYSTTLFEASISGIPTILWEHNTSKAKIFIDDFQYPLGITNTKEITQKILQYKNNEKQWQVDSKKVTLWSKRFYSPINEESFVNLIRGYNA